MSYSICSYDEIKRAKSDFPVVMGSHTRNLEGTHKETIKKGELYNIDTANNGTIWILFDFQGVNENGYRTFNKRGKI